jgi:hypothetical protein
MPESNSDRFGRILVFYCLTTLLLGLNLPYNSPDLQFAEGASKNSVAEGASKGSAAASPFVALAKLAGLKIFTDIINGALLVFIMSSANSDLYIASRTLYGLAEEGVLPAFFKKTANVSFSKIFKRKNRQQSSEGYVLMETILFHLADFLGEFRGFVSWFLGSSPHSLTSLLRETPKRVSESPK